MSKNLLGLQLDSKNKMKKFAMEETAMSERLNQIIDYRTGGQKAEFCRLMGWKPPYLSKLLKGADFGIRPVLRVLEVMPEIDARWFLLGTGEMLGEGKRAQVLRDILDGMLSVLDIERYMPVMSAEELRRFEGCVIKGRKPDFSPETVAGWSRRLDEREAIMEARISAATGGDKAKGRK